MNEHYPNKPKLPSNRFKHVAGRSIGVYRLTAPRRHVIYNRDINITFSFPEGIQSNTAHPMVVQLFRSGQDQVPLVTLPLTYPGSRQGYLRLSCALIDRPGLYVFRLLTGPGDRTLAESNALMAVWPEVTLTPHIAMTPGEKTMTIDIEISATVVCDDVTRSDVTYTLELVYYGRNHTSSDNLTSPLYVVYTSKLYKLYRETQVSFAVPCGSPTISLGFYRSRLRSSADPENFVKVSDPIWVSETRTPYSLSFQPVLQCAGDFRVRYRRPSCLGSSRDCVRLYRKVYRVEGLATAPHDLEYVGERRTGDGHEEDVRFPCDFFEEATDEAEYCLKYISILSDGVLHEMYSTCFKANGEPASKYQQC